MVGFGRIFSSYIQALNTVNMLLLGYDLGSSSVKASVLHAETGEVLVSAQFPDTELEIDAPQSGWAEQDPEIWWDCIKAVSQRILAHEAVHADQIGGIGISYQMHGLVLVDKNHQVLRPAIIWCDSRAVGIGDQAFSDLGKDYCLENLLNGPGNFTASKFRWVCQHEPEIAEKVDKLLLPGDYIALRMTGSPSTTISGLSEGILWNFKKQAPAQKLMDHYGIRSDQLAEMVPTFGIQGRLLPSVAQELGLKAGTPISYRAGDQPNNALSLNVLEPGEIAATAGTSGVIYGVSDQLNFDPQSRINSFAHVNYSQEVFRLGILLCVNGSGILNRWLKHQMADGTWDYAQMNHLAEQAPTGSDGLVVLPFGNGAERILKNRNLGGQIHHLDFNRHSQTHLFRAAQEGIVFALYYGLEVFAEMNMSLSVIRAGKANMFLSPLFRNTLANICQVPIELYNTDGAQGAARGAGIGLGYYANMKEAFSNLRKIDTVEPHSLELGPLKEAYGHWRETLAKVE